MKRLWCVFVVAMLLFSLAGAQGAAQAGADRTSGSFRVSQSGESGEVINVTIIVPLINKSQLSQQQQAEADAIMQKISAECQHFSNPQEYRNCVLLKSQQLLAGASFFYRSIKDAPVLFEFYNPVTATYEPIAACGGVNGLQASAGVSSPEYGTAVYYATCEVPQELYRGVKSKVRISYLNNGEMVSLEDATGQPKNYIVEVSPIEVPVSAVSVNIIDAIYASITQGIRGVAAQQPAACLGAFLILGLLLASMYFSGKSPISLLDITSPRLPSPKGLTASGQIILPYGYAEMKKATAAKLAAASAALGASVNRMASSYQYTSDWRKTQADIAALRADPQQKRVLEAIAVGALSTGKNYSQIKHLLGKLPSKYGDKEHETVAQILAAMTAQGGSSAVMAATIKDSLLAWKMLEKIEPLSGTPSGKYHKKFVQTLGKFVGPNRYGGISSMILGPYASVIRTTRVLKDTTKEMVKAAPELARGVARTVIEISPAAAARVKAKAAEEGIAGALARQVLKPASAGMEIGKKTRIDEKMARHYEQLLNETKTNALAYLLKQAYKALGVNFALSEKDMLEFALKDVDILKKCGYAQNAAKIAAMEKEILGLLGGKMSVDEKIALLAKVAQKYGAAIDPEMFKFLDRLNAIDKTYGREDGYLKFIALQEFLTQHEQLAKAARTNEVNASDRFYSVVGRGSINGSDIWETMVLRTMLWDAEKGYLKGGLKEGLQRAWLDSVNRLIGLNPTSNLKELPEFMRNEGELRKIEARVRFTLVDLMSNEGKGWFRQQYGKAAEQATIAELIGMLYGKGRLPADMERLKGDRLGRMAFWEDAATYGPAAEWFKVDMKRHWVGKLEPREAFAIGQWVESRFSRSNIPPYKASIEAELDRMPESRKWSIAERTTMAKKLWVVDQLKQDYEQRFNSQFCQDAYGKLPERAAFYYGILLGFYEKALKDKGLVENHPDLRFVATMDTNNVKDLKKFRTDIALKYKSEFMAEMKSPVTFNDVLTSSRPVVQLYEGDYAYYRRGMALSVNDKVYGDVALKDNKGRWNKFVAEDVVIDFARYGRADLDAEYRRLAKEKVQPGPDWDNYIENVKKWANEGGYDYEKQRIFAALVSRYGKNTADYMKYWRDTGLEIKPVRETMEIAPQSLRMFGVDAEKGRLANTLLKNLKTELGSFFVKTMLAGGKPVIDALYDSVPTSAYLKDHSWRLAADLYANRWNAWKEMSAAERKAYEEAAISHFAYHHAWSWAIDRAPRLTPSQGLLQATESAYHHGPGHIIGKTKDYVGATMTRGEWAAFYAFYGWPMDVAAKVHKNYLNVFRTMQVAMQGYPSRWDVNQADALKPFEYTDARPLEALRSVSNILGTGKLSKLKVWESAAEQRHQAGAEILAGLRQAPSDIFFRRTGVEVIARVGMANPAASYYDYRYNLNTDEAMASYLWRNRDAVYRYDKEIEQQAFRSTVRRTVSAEALAMKYEQESQRFGIMQNPVYGWFNPVLFAWHLPLPFWPSSMTFRDAATRYAARRKYGHEEPWSARVAQAAEDLASGIYRAATPWKGSMVVYCPKCGRSGYRGSMCICGTPLYAGKLPDHRKAA